MKIAIIDDISVDIEMISNYIHTYLDAQSVQLSFSIETFENGADFFEMFQPYTYDIVFIEHCIKGASGLNIAYKIRQSDDQVKIIFTTSSRAYAVESYNVQASGYLVKPISYEEFAKMFSRIDLRQIKQQQYIQVTSGYKLLKIVLNHILYCDISGHYVQIHTNSFEVCRTRMTFEKIKELLKPYSEFLSCYKGCIINMNHIHHIEDSVFILENGEHIPFRKRQQKEIIKIYSDYLFAKVRSEPVTCRN